MNFFNRLRLSHLSVSHVDHVLTWVNDEEVRKDYSCKKVYTREEELAFIQKLCLSHYDRVFSIFNGDEYVGQVGLHNIDWEEGEATVGLTFCRNAWGKGFSKYVIELFLEKAFYTYGLRSLSLTILTTNEKCKHIWRRAGFTEVKVMKNYYKVDGVLRDMVLMSMYDIDWKAKYHS